MWEEINISLQRKILSVCAIYIESRICSWGRSVLYLLQDRFCGACLILSPLDGDIIVCDSLCQDPNSILIHRSIKFFGKRWHIYILTYYVRIFFVRIYEVRYIWLNDLDLIAQLMHPIYMDFRELFSLFFKCMTIIQMSMFLSLKC